MFINYPFVLSCFSPLHIYCARQDKGHCNQLFFQMQTNVLKNFVSQCWNSDFPASVLSSRLAKAYKYAKRFYKKGFVYQNIRCSILLSQLTYCSQRTKRKWRLVGFVVKNSYIATFLPHFSDIFILTSVFSKLRRSCCLKCESCFLCLCFFFQIIQS